MFETRQILLLLFCLNKDQFWFLLMLRTSSAEVWQKKMQGNANFSAPKTVIGVTKVANERYLPYLQLLEGLQCELSCIVGVKVAQS